VTARSPSAFLTSAALHGAVVALALLLTYVSQPSARETPKIFEVVAGEGENYTATEAPALGSPSGVKLDLPKPPAPKAEPVKAEPLPPEPSPITPEAPVAPPKPVESKAPPRPEKTIKQQIMQKIWNADANAKKKAAKERAEEKKRMTKEQFDRANKEKSSAKSAPVKIAKIDEKGIAKGVRGGSIANTTGGAGGKALTAPERSAVDAYVAALIQRLKEELDRTPGLEDGLTAEAEFQILPDGRLTRGQITLSSRNEAFDRAVLRAITAVKMGPRPKGLDQLQTVPFSTHAKN
jgi:colicin import membrane protein